MKHILRKVLPLALALALLLSLAPGALADGAAVTKVTLSPSSTIIKVGDPAELTATVTFTPSGEDDTIDPVTCTASKGEGDAEIVRLGTPVLKEDPDGKENTKTFTIPVTGLAVGTARITATCGGKTSPVVTVTVDPIVATGVTLSPTLNIQMGKTGTLSATIIPDNATDQTLTWSVTNTKMVSLDKTTTLAGESVTVTGLRNGQTTITATAGNGISAECAVTVSAVEIDATQQLRDGQLEFADLLSTLRAYCQNITGSPLSYLSSISVNTPAGTLYEGYVSEADHGEGVSPSQRYYDSSSGLHQLGRITFVPRPGFSGDATIIFTATAESGDLFTGNILVSIPGTNLIYTSESGEPVCFKSSDFEKYIRSKGHSTFSYVKFNLPKSTEGTLYYNYIDSDINEGPVSSSTQFKRAGYPYLDKVWFLPHRGFSGVVSISFSYTDTSGNIYTDGILQVHITNAAGANGDKGDISYSVRPGALVSFKVADFSDLCSEIYTDSTLTSVRFTTLPASSYGTLYCGSKGKVTTSQNIYRTGASGSWLLSDVYFAANANYSGTFSIPFTATTNKGTFTGTVAITVSADANTNYATGSIIAYSSGGEAVAFRSQDFFYDAAQYLTQPLSTVRFYTPEVSQGRLCLNYGSPTNYASLDTSREYPYTTVSSISFQPRSGFSGAAYIRFISTDQSGKSYTGILAVNVDPPTSSNYFNDLSGYSWATPSVDFLAHSNILIGTEYRTFSPAGLTKRGDFILMLQRCFDFSSDFNNVFADVPEGSYYASAIAGAYAIGLATGDGNGRFRPDAPLTRQEAAEFLYRCMKRSGSLQDGTAADLASFSDRGQISAYAVTAMATLVRLGVLTGDESGRLNPTHSLTRAEMAVMFHRALT